METAPQHRNRNTTIALVGGIVVALILVLGKVWMGNAGKSDTDEAVRSVSLLYLDELAGRREQVVSSNLQDYIADLEVASSPELLTDADLANPETLKPYQARMKRLYNLDKFAFVDEDGTIYTAVESPEVIDDYLGVFDYRTISGPQIGVLDPYASEKKVVIALPYDRMLGDKRLVACFMEIDLNSMLNGVSMSTNNEVTFCNIYTRDGIGLANAVLNGLAGEQASIFDAFAGATFEAPYSYERFVQEFSGGISGEVSFMLNDHKATLSFVPVEGTDWVLTYLIRETVISEKIGYISSGIVRRSIIQSALTVLALLAVFAFIVSQNRQNARALLERETAEAEERAKREGLEQRLALQEELLEQEKQRARQEEMITALSSDYRSVYYLELDRDWGTCYQSRSDLEGFKVGDEFPYLAAVTAYCNKYVVESYREEFLRFIQIEHVRNALKNHRVISFTYLINIDGREFYEMVRFAAVRKADEVQDGEVSRVGACFTDVDRETRHNLAQNQALADALAVAERANTAKTAFLSNMSHEIRTPMNAIIGLDNIALNEPDLPESTRSHLEKIGASAEHLLNLINDILDMSRIESGRLVLRNEEFSFSRLLEAINTMFSGQAADRGLDYQCHINGAVDDYYIGDNMKLRQVLINILGNAVKFTPEGGRVELGVERIAQFEGQSTLRFTIADTGIGMSEEFIPHLFDTFSQEDSSTTNKYGSSGLGMAITKNIVEMMNGDIQVKSKKGEGTTFVVTVTLADAVREDADEDVDISAQEMSVLIIDDDPVACEHAKLVLERVGIAAEVADSGTAAVEMVKLRHARRDPYNLILVDWQMPDMDGVETTRRMRDVIGNESAIIILTAYRWDDVLEEAIQAGVDSFIPKPLFATTVLEEFKAALKKKGIAARREQHKADLKGRKILLAEDMKVNAEIMMMVLKMREIEVDLAENGRIAVEKFEASEPGHYDAVLMDMRMPEMDGLEATRTIRALDREDARRIPIIALTANAFDEDVQRSLQAGLNAHLTKPVQPEALFETLESLIED